MKPVNDIIIRILLREIPDITGIYLFGSQVDGTLHDDSDFDIAFLTEEPKNFDTFFLFDLANKIGSAISGNVDLINLHKVSLDLRFEVVAKGLRIYCADKTACDTFDMLSISMYQRFEEERKSLVEAYKQRIASWQIR